MLTRYWLEKESTTTKVALLKLLKAQSIQASKIANFQSDGCEQPLGGFVEPPDSDSADIHKVSMHECKNFIEAEECVNMMDNKCDSCSKILGCTQCKDKNKATSLHEI